MTVVSTKYCVVTLRQTAMSVHHDFHKEQQLENSEDEKLKNNQNGCQAH